MTLLSGKWRGASLEVWQDASTANALGVLKLSLHAGSYDWQFVPVAGKTFTDSGTGTAISANSAGG